MASILFLIIGVGKPSSKKRVLESLDYLRSRGHGVEAVEVKRGLAERARLLSLVGGHDLVVIQKKLFSGPELSLLRRASRDLIFDFDDAVMFHEVERGEPLNGRYFSRFTATVAACRGVIAGNTYLAGFARAAAPADTKVLVLPTPVDTDAVTIKDYGGSEGKVVIGWMGTKGNLAHLKAIEGPLRKVFEGRPEALLRVVCDSRPEMPGIPVEYKPWSREEEADDLRGFDIGVMPLIDNIWTRGKGGFKLLQYMAAGVPAVASPVGINSEIVKDGVNGWLAGDDDGWSRALTALISDPALRERLGKAGRKTVEDGYSLNIYNRRLAEFLERFL